MNQEKMVIFLESLGIPYIVLWFNVFNKELLTLRSNFRLTKKFLIAKFDCTVKLGNKERFDKEQIGIKELIMDYQPFHTINLLLDKELLPL